MSAAPQNKRYPGVKPFETSERNLFFGRDKDAEDLLDLVWLEKLVVLFGKSGYGKSSLINAGLLPEIEKEAVPVVVRLGACVAGQTPSPLDNLRARLHEAAPDNPDAAFLDALGLPKTLWSLAKRKQSARQRRFVLIFDQFEEFFTYPVAEQNAFKDQLAELLYTEVPQAVRNLGDRLTAEEQTFIAQPFDAKVLLAIRADRISLLESMKDKLPAILQKRYELKGLTEAQARQAIERPASSGGDFASPKFAYSDEALRVMTQKLSETKGAQRSGIEAFQLQILCEFLEDKIIKGEITNNIVEPGYFADKITEIYSGYYKRLVDKLDPAVREPAKLLIEENLLFEDEKTGDARRLSVDSGVLMSRPGVTQTLLNQLESTFLLRRESTSTGGFNYEVSHDTMIAPILESKAERKAAEAAEEIRLAARRKQRRLVALLGIAGLALALMFGLVAFFINLRNEALHAKDEAEKSKTEAIKERDTARKALQDKKITEFGDVLRRARSILNRENNCPSQDMIQAIDRMKIKYPDNLSLQQDIKNIELKMARCR